MNIEVSQIISSLTSKTKQFKKFKNPILLYFYNLERL